MEEGISLFKLHYFEILTYIRDNEPCQKSEIYEILGGSNTTRTKNVNTLINQELIEETRTGLHNKKLITLTEKGKAILKEMEKINAIMNGEVMPDERNHGAPSAGHAKAEGE